jgi:hypothetical protein
MLNVQINLQPQPHTEHSLSIERNPLSDITGHNSNHNVPQSHTHTILSSVCVGHTIITSFPTTFPMSLWQTVSLYSWYRHLHANMTYIMSILHRYMSKLCTLGTVSSTAVSHSKAQCGPTSINCPKWLVTFRGSWAWYPPRGYFWPQHY